MADRKYVAITVYIPWHRDVEAAAHAEDVRRGVRGVYKDPRRIAFGSPRVVNRKVRR